MNKKQVKALVNPLLPRIEKIRTESKCFQKSYDSLSQSCNKYCPDAELCKQGSPPEEDPVKTNKFKLITQKGVTKEYRENAHNKGLSKEAKVNKKNVDKFIKKRLLSGETVYTDLYKEVKEEFGIENPKNTIELVLHKLQDEGYEASLEGRVIKLVKEV